MLEAELRSLRRLRRKKHLDQTHSQWNCRAIFVQCRIVRFQLSIQQQITTAYPTLSRKPTDALRRTIVFTMNWSTLGRWIYDSLCLQYDEQVSCDIGKIWIATIQISELNFSVQGGERTRDEMCLHMFIYYPRMDRVHACISRNYGTAWGSVLKNISWDSRKLRIFTETFVVVLVLMPIITLNSSEMSAGHQR